jgi:hypothetical protein
LIEDDADLAAVEEMQKRIGPLSQSEPFDPSFKEKLKTSARRIVKTMKIQILKLRRKRLLRKVGRQIAEEKIADNSLAAETREVQTASEKLQSVDAEIQALATQTYVWARRPLLTGSVVLALAIIFAGVAYEQEVATPDTSTPKKEAIAFYDALSANQMKLARSLAIGPESALTTVKLGCDLGAAMSRYRGAEAKKFGNAATAEKPLREELESAQEKIEGDTAQVDPWHLRKVDGRWRQRVNYFTTRQVILHV